MKKSTLIPAIVFLILAGGLFFVLTNAHVDVFSGTETEHDYFTEKDVVKEKSVSLLAVSRGDATLDAAGYATAAGVILVFPLIVAWLIKKRLVKKQNAKMANDGPQA